MECLGCKIANHIEQDVHVIYEDDYISCILDIKPFNEGHLLILPKEHCRDLEELSQETLIAVMNASVKMSRTIKKIYKPDGITICQNGGLFNDLTHYHMHVIPRYKGDGFHWSEPTIEHNAKNKLKETKQKIIKELSGVTQGSQGHRIPTTYSHCGSQAILASSGRLCGIHPLA